LKVGDSGSRLAVLASVLLLLILLLIPGMMGVSMQTRETANFELQAVDHSTDGTNDKLCFAVPIIPRGIHVIKDHVNPRGIMMRKHSLECFYSSGDRGFVY
jgi:hypothetical protein